MLLLVMIGIYYIEFNVYDAKNKTNKMSPSVMFGIKILFYCSLNHQKRRSEEVVLIHFMLSVFSYISKHLKLSSIDTLRTRLLENRDFFKTLG